MPAIVESPSSNQLSLFNQKGQVIAFGNAEFIQTDSSDTHQTILQGLNRWMKYDNGEKYFLDAEAFQGTEKAWDKVPAIFAQEHPEDFDLVDTDLETALSQLKDYKGRPGSICGSLSNSDVLIPGQPRLSSEVTFTDPEVQALYKKGKLSLSTGFTCTPGDDGHLTGKVRPNHVLIFVVDDNSQPRDKAAMLLNLKKEEDMDATHAGRVISDKNKSRFKQALDLLASLFSEMAPAEDVKQQETTPPVIPASNQEGDEMAEAELKNQIDAATKTITAKDTEIANKDAEIKKLTDAQVEFQNKLAKIEQDRKDDAWKVLKNKIPPGWIDTTEHEAEIRKMAETDALSFGNKLADHRLNPDTAEQGQHHAQNTTAPIVRRGIGVINKAGKWED